MTDAFDRDDELVASFLDESIESLQHLPHHLAAHRRSPDDREPINQVFRAVHSIKGNSSFFGMGPVHQFSHSLEHTLDALRNGDLRLSDDLHQAIVESFDLLEDMLQSVADGAADVEPPAAAANLLERLEAAAGRVGGGQSEAPAEADDGAAAAEAQSAADRSSAPGRATAKTVRVKETRLDEFGADVASLFVTCEQLKELQSRVDLALGQDALAKEFRDLSAVFSEQIGSLEQSVAALRKVPVRPLLAKIARLARTLAGQLGQKIHVHLAGEETEVDKTLLEDLDAPLMHIVRNAVDHGIETPRQRRARGLDEAGNLWLGTELTHTHVVVTVRDDGRGIDPARIREKALEKEVASQAELQVMSDRELVGLVFHPGMTTAEKVTNVSGRGVGLDVVQTNVRKHNGDIHVQSQLGVGSTFRLEIPIRRMVVVIDALLVEQAGAIFAVPFKHIDRIMECDAGDLKQVQGSAVVATGKRCVAAVSLGVLLGIRAARAAEPQRTPAVLVGSGKDEICLLVDRVVGRKKVVVSDIGGLVEGAEKFAGIAQLGGERLALVLSVPELVATCTRRESAATRNNVVPAPKPPGRPLAPVRAAAIQHALA
jgi:two-component system chemotaxis sensor kinase CheA